MNWKKKNDHEDIYINPFNITGFLFKYSHDPDIH